MNIKIDKPIVLKINKYISSSSSPPKLEFIIEHIQLNKYEVKRSRSQLSYDIDIDLNNEESKSKIKSKTKIKRSKYMDL